MRGEKHVKLKWPIEMLFSILFTGSLVNNQSCDGDKTTQAYMSRWMVPYNNGGVYYTYLMMLMMMLMMMTTRDKLR